jgi:PleD family two-component response regulator
MDTVARLGGDEFAVLVEDIDTPVGAAAVAQRC